MRDGRSATSIGKHSLFNGAVTVRLTVQHADEQPFIHAVN